MSGSRYSPSPIPLSFSFQEMQIFATQAASLEATVEEREVHT